MLLAEIICFQNSGGPTVLRRLGLDKSSSQITCYLDVNHKGGKGYTGTLQSVVEKKKKKGKEDLITVCNNVAS